MPTKVFLLASVTLFAAASFQPAQASDVARPLMLAQATGGAPQTDKEKLEKEKREKEKGKPPEKKQVQPPHQQAQPPKPAPQQQLHQQAQPPKPPTPPVERQVQPPKQPVVVPPRVEEKRELRHDQRQNAAPVQPVQPKTTPTVQGTKPVQPSVTVAPVKPAPQTQPTVSGGAPVIVQPKNVQVKPHDAGEFIRRNNQGTARTLKDVKRERTETKQGNSTIIHEGDRVIVRQNNRTIIQHNEQQRFAIGARNVETRRQGDQTVTVVIRPNGVNIITTTDRNGRLLRRVRRDANGRQYVLIDNAFRGAPRSYFLNLPRPVVRIPRDRYIVEAWRVRPEEIYDTFEAPPVMEIEHPYTLDEVLYNDPLRERMRRVDLDINFDTGSWQLTPDQIDRLGAVADALLRAIDRNPREVFLIEGHTDAVGSEEDNLSLSDRRAEAVAVALTEQFNVPAENLVTQGYGEEYLKVPTQGPERANRRVAIRRITPLLDQQAGR